MKLKNLIREKLNKLSCRRGKHRWTQAYKKTENENEMIRFKFCQSCGVTENV